MTEFYTETNFPSYETLEKHKVSGLTKERYDRVRRGYIGTPVPPRELYPENPEEKGLLSWADHQIAESITYSLYELFYTETNFPSYETLEKHKVSGLTKERYDRVRRGYIGTPVPPRELYPENPEEKGLLSWADHQIAEIITYDL